MVSDTVFHRRKSLFFGEVLYEKEWGTVEAALGSGKEAASRLLAAG